MNTFEGMQAGIVGAIVGFLSFFGLKAISAVETKTESVLLPALVGGVIFTFLYAVIILLGFYLGESWHRRLANGFVYGMLGGILGQVLGSLEPIARNGLFNEILITALSGLLVTLLFFEAKRHTAFILLITVITLFSFIFGTKDNLHTITTAILITIGAWLVYPLLPTLLIGLKEK